MPSFFLSRCGLRVCTGGFSHVDEVGSIGGQRTMPMTWDG